MDDRRVEDNEKDLSNINFTSVDTVLDLVYPGCYSKKEHRHFINFFSILYVKKWQNN